MAQLKALLAKASEDCFPDLKVTQHQALLDMLYAKTREDDIKALVASLDVDALDTLMKFIYKGLELGKNSGVLFKWHAAVEEAGGLGCIVRTLTDSRPMTQDEEAADA
uniref:Actin-related protein 2/3 complex subunit 5 n=1 Tax=Eutreptiella gymnastica TaxID=73025 RepID=A0A7S1IUA7_9EUGL